MKGCRPPYCGLGSSYGHLYSAMEELRAKGHKVALAQFKYVNPLPKNTAEVLAHYKKVVVAEQNLGQLAALLRIRINISHLISIIK